jgi:hypothetical protein
MEVYLEAIDVDYGTLAADGEIVSREVQVVNVEYTVIRHGHELHGIRQFPPNILDSTPNQIVEEIKSTLNI